jgi:alpha-L-rhamnosidase
LADGRTRRIVPAAPGYSRIRIAPLVSEHLDHASTTVATPYGTASSAWRRNGGEVTLEVSVPLSATAEIQVADSTDLRGEPHVIGSGEHSFTWAEANIAKSHPAALPSTVELKP